MTLKINENVLGEDEFFIHWYPIEKTPLEIDIPNGYINLDKRLRSKHLDAVLIGESDENEITWLYPEQKGNKPYKPLFTYNPFDLVDYQVYSTAKYIFCQLMFDKNHPIRKEDYKNRKYFIPLMKFVGAGNKVYHSGALLLGNISYLAIVCENKWHYVALGYHKGHVYEDKNKQASITNTYHSEAPEIDKGINFVTFHVRKMIPLALKEHFEIVNQFYS